MTAEMKAFLDHELLEGKIPDRFEAVAGFQQLLNRAGVTLSSPAPGPVPPPAPAVQRQAGEAGPASPSAALEIARMVGGSRGRRPAPPCP